jgi:hypothetical protein
MDKKTVIARPLLRLSKMSDRKAGEMARGQAPKNPPKNRHIRIVWRSFPVATAIEKIEKPKPEIRRGGDNLPARTWVPRGRVRM